MQVEDTIEQTKTKHKDENQRIHQDYAAQLDKLTMQLQECEDKVVAATGEAANVQSKLQQEVQQMTTALNECQDSLKKKLAESVASCTSRLTAIEKKHNAKTAKLAQAEKSVIALQKENTRLQALLLEANLKAETATRINENLTEEAKHCADDLVAFAKTRQQYKECRSELLTCKGKLDECNEKLDEANQLIEETAANMRELTKWRLAVGCEPDAPCDEGIAVFLQMVNRFQLLEIELADEKDENAGLKRLLASRQ